MTTEITVYDGVEDPVSAMAVMGAAIAKSKIFGCSNPEQGQVIALECMAMKLSPLTMAKKYHFIGGKLEMKSQAMLAEFRKDGGKTVLVDKSAECAAINMTDRDGHEYQFELTWKDAKQEAFPYVGKESDIVKMLAEGGTPELKPKYSTPRSRANMLWNRLISDAVRTIAPEINCGQYTADEIEDIHANDGGVVEIEHSPAAIAAIEAAKGSKTVDPYTAEVEQDAPTDAEFELKPNAPAEAETTTQLITGDDAAPISGGAIPQTIDRIKAGIMQAAQLDMPDLGKKVKAKLTESGLDTLADLTEAEAQILMSAIDEKNLGQWFDIAIEGHASAAGNDTPTGE